MTPNWPFPKVPLDYPVAPPIPSWVRPRKTPPPNTPLAPF
jgi:hypothetical protein